MDTFGDAKVTVIGGTWVVTIGATMPDWKKHQLIAMFRAEFKSCNIRLEGSGVNISGEATMRTHF